MGILVVLEEDLHLSLRNSNIELLSLCVYGDGTKVNRVLESYFESNGKHLSGCLIDNDLVGLIGIEMMSESAARLTHISVSLSQQKQGMGRAMIAETLSHFDLQSLEAETDQEAVGFYRSLGFAEHSLGEKYPGVERFRCVIVKGSGTEVNG
ncbi:N-acetyltransferase [Paenibacillus sambharensis]|uniref:N-acetyltransferase n=1 Tax=Paenibacillus sambharensis TaxID=1803190 RepID=A0A2W1LAJ4_9BACL|nr:GNAT family N-acetyltransferase [Paenibacillus sambharensis]PZD97268.1 N-acetyltransferase [Paenibacillus sambharensis]